MKLLETEIVRNIDKCGDHTFKQLRLEDNVALYSRTKMDGSIHSYEVFTIKIVKAGTPLPNGTVVTEDYQHWPTKNDFGKTAWTANSAELADNLFERVKAKMAKKAEYDAMIIDDTDIPEDDTESIEGNAENAVPDKIPGKRGRKAIERPDIKYPTTASFTMKDLVSLNEPEWNHALLYPKLQEAITGSKVQEIDRVSGGRGKPAVIYSLVNPSV